MIRQILRFSSNTSRTKHNQTHPIFRPDSRQKITFTSFCSTKERTAEQRGRDFLKTYNRLEERLHDIFSGTYGIANLLDQVKKTALPFLTKHYPLFLNAAHIRNRCAHGMISEKLPWIPSETALQRFENAVLEICQPRRIQDCLHAYPPVKKHDDSLESVADRFNRHLSIVYRTETGELALLTIRTLIRYLLQYGNDRILDPNHLSIAEIATFNQECWHCHKHDALLSSARKSIAINSKANQDFLHSGRLSVLRLVN